MNSAKVAPCPPPGGECPAVPPNRRGSPGRASRGRPARSISRAPKPPERALRRPRARRTGRPRAPQRSIRAAAPPSAPLERATVARSRQGGPRGSSSRPSPGSGPRTVPAGPRPMRDGPFRDHRRGSSRRATIALQVASKLSVRATDGLDRSSAFRFETPPRAPRPSPGRRGGRGRSDRWSPARDAPAHRAKSGRPTAPDRSPERYRPRSSPLDVRDARDGPTRANP